MGGLLTNTTMNTGDLLVDSGASIKENEAVSCEEMDLSRILTVVTMSLCMHVHVKSCCTS